MNRRGTGASIRRLLDACRARGIAVRTTMIVGFPGETDAQFEELLAFVADARFARLGAFTYSPEEGTAAFDMPGGVEEDVKQARLDRLMTLQQQISLRFNEDRVGETLKVLVDGAEDGRYVARSTLEAPEVDGVIYVTGKRALSPGEYIAAHITGADAYDLYGEAVE
jgi:ribosomal protein S12 methylthiotransferase